MSLPTGPKSCWLRLVPHDVQDASEVHRCESLAKVVGSIHSTNMATTYGSRRETAGCLRLRSKLIRDAHVCLAVVRQEYVPSTLWIRLCAGRPHPMLELAPQCRFQELAGRGMGQAGNKNELIGQLPLSEFAGQKRAQLLSSNLAIIFKERQRRAVFPATWDAAPRPLPLPSQPSEQQEHSPRPLS